MQNSSRLIPFCIVFFAAVLAVNAQTGGAAANCEPRVEMSTILSNVEVDGVLSIGKLYARCLPMPAVKGKTNYEYHPYDGGKFSTTLKSSSGQTINTFVWYGDNIQSLWEFTRYEVVGGPKALKTVSPGSYVLEFALEDKVFQRFPFTVTTQPSSDQFRPETLYYTDGPWRDYAHIYAPNVDRFFQLAVWLRTEEALADPKRVTTALTMKLIREKDKKLLGVNDGSKPILTNKWHVFTLSFRRPNEAETKDYSEFKLNEVLAVDGRYRIELAVEGKPRADYLFTVKNGQINGIDLAQNRKENFRIIVPLSRER